MHSTNYSSNPVNRRSFLKKSAMGFGSLASLSVLPGVSRDLLSGHSSTLYSLNPLYHKKLKEYRYCGELCDLQDGYYIRWISLKDPEKIKQRWSSVLIDKRDLIMIEYLFNDFIEELELLPEKEKRLMMVKEGLQIVKQYDWKEVGKLYLDTYQSLLQS